MLNRHHVRIRRHMLAALAVTFAALAALAGAAAASWATDVHELLQSTGPGNTKFAPLAAVSTYRASLVNPTPTVTSPVAGWTGAQFVTHQHGKVRYEWAALLWQHDPGGDVAIISGPAMTMSAKATVQWPATRGAAWSGPVKRWTVAGRRAYAVDGTNPGPYGFTLLGRNPPEDETDVGQSYRMAALTVRGKTVVIIIQTPKGEALAQFLPIAERLLTSLRFPAA
jgi:hypothetical protein